MKSQKSVITLEIDEDVLAAAIIFVIGVLGFTSLILSLVMIYRNKAFHNAFGYLCFFQAIGHVGVLIGFAFWASPITMWAPKLGNTRLGQEITAFPTLYCYYAVIFAHILKGFNRFVAVWFPTVYPRLFTTRNTFVFMGLGLVCAACINVPHHISKSPKPL
ncbi:Protein SRX-13 [Aphelenchoides avenae]|nr:Protein SRX-13 [Aphelenchus avenae]